MKRTIAMGAALVCAAGAAHADSRAWAAAKQAFPAHLGWVGGGRFDSADAHKVMKTIIAKAVAAKPDDAKMLLTIKRVCGVELQDAIDSFAVGSPGDPDDAALVIALHGLDRPAAEHCLQALAKDFGATMTVKTSGALTLYDDGSDTVAVRWLGKDVFAVSLDDAKPDKLTRMTAGGLATDKDMLALIARAQPDATFWGAGAVATHTDITGIDVPLAQELGHVDITGDQVKGEVHLVTTDAKTAAKAADKNRSEMIEVENAADAPPLLRTVFKGLSVRADGRDLVYTARLRVADLVELGMLMTEK